MHTGGRSRVAQAAVVATALLGLFPGPAAAAPGDIIASVGTVLYRFDPSTGQRSVVASGPQLDGLGDVAFAPDGQIVAVAGSDKPALLSIDPNSGKSSTIVTGRPFTFLGQVDVAPDRAMIVTGATSGGAGVFRVDPKDGEVTSLGSPPGEPIAVDVGPTGRIWATAGSNGFGLDEWGNWRQIIVNGDRPSGVWGIAEVPPHPALGTRVMVSSSNTGYIQDVYADFQQAGVRHQGSGMKYPTDLAPLPNGDLIVADSQAEPEPGLRGAILRLHANPADPGDHWIKVVAAGPPLPSIRSVAVEPPRCAGRPATVVGSPGKDKLRGSRFSDVIVGLGGHDVIRGGPGKDLICGGKGPDRLLGGKGIDRHLGGAGRDACAGGRERRRDCEKLA